MAKFQPIHSLIEPSFWHALSKKKLNDMMLDEQSFRATAFFQAGRSTGVLSFAFLNEDSLKDSPTLPTVSHYLNYTATFPINVHLLNTKSAFQSLDRKSILNSLSQSVLTQLSTKGWLSNPSVLLESAITIFGDLKKWQFTYVPAFPAILNNTSITLTLESEFSGEISSIPNWAFAITQSGASVPLAEATPDCTFAVIDPSTSGDLGWPLQLLIFAIADHFKLTTIKFLRLNFESRLFTVTVASPLGSDATFGGWRLNNKKPYFVDLSATMNPEMLFVSASQLNLRLMKWRMAPQLDVDLIRRQGALLIGCGTLGCNVARDLLGWGVRKFTLIDYGRVSYSNPPRQPLFTFQDCLDGGRPKAEAAAEELKRICPDVEVSFDAFEIPMPGHHMGPKQVAELASTISRLDGLIQKHDVTFLLTDTRESRWLPTVICAAHGKTSVSVALGFDTFSAIRSGSRDVGCYFCNDIIAPVDTMTDRTLDMQCTVTRPGIAPLASAVGVELWVSLIQRKAGEEESILGMVPQHIRGFLHNWQILTVSGGRFANCVACSDPVIQGYREQGPAFVEKAANQPGFLEDVSGITEMKSAMVDETCDLIDES
jgi:ubiquitin-like modifier-activating enzyme ATG7